MVKTLTHYKFLFLALGVSLCTRLILFLNHNPAQVASYELDNWHHIYTAVLMYVTGYFLFNIFQKPFPWYIQALIVGIGLDELYVPICKILCELEWMQPIIYFSRFELSLVVIGYLLFIIFNLIYKPFYDFKT